jgi:multidrug transporter EmrE-like cation transporter
VLGRGHARLAIRALAAIAGVVLFRERIGRVQATGVATIAAGVAVLAALRA